jgi:hypothetical protein
MKSPVTVRTTGGRLVVDASTGPVPVLGVFFLLIGGIFVYGLLGGFVNLYDVERWERAVAWAVSLTVMGAGVWILHEARSHRTVIDPVRRTVVIARRAPFHTAREQIRLAEVREAVVTREVDSDGDPVHGVAIELQGNRRASLTPILYTDHAICDRATAEINRFLEGTR